jgi:hypothetical protein
MVAHAKRRNVRSAFKVSVKTKTVCHRRESAAPVVWVLRGPISTDRLRSFCHVVRGTLLHCRQAKSRTVHERITRLWKSGGPRSPQDLRCLAAVTLPKRLGGLCETSLRWPGHYLGRYTHRVAISNHRLVSFTDAKVTFRWRDSAHNNEQKLMTLSLDEFLAASCCTCFPKASCAFAISGSWPTGNAHPPAALFSIAGRSTSAPSRTKRAIRQ